jgi:hypothetical protein
MQRRVRRLDAVVSASLRPEDMAGLGRVVRTVPADRIYAPIDLAALPSERGAFAAALVGDGILADEKEAESPRGGEVVTAFERLVSAVSDPWDSRRVGQYLFLSPAWTVRALAGGGPTPEVADRGLVLYEEEAPGGRVEVVALHPPAGAGDETPVLAADRSLVVKITHGDVAVLLAHGIDAAGAAEVARMPAARADAVLLPGHGGARIPHAFIDQVGASVAVASFRPRGRAGRTEESRLAALAERLDGLGVRLFRTDENGAVRLSSDGRTLTATSTLRGPDDEEVVRRPVDLF